LAAVGGCCSQLENGYDKDVAAEKLLERMQRCPRLKVVDEQQNAFEKQWVTTAASRRRLADALRYPSAATAMTAAGKASVRRLKAGKRCTKDWKGE
jgi:hypothetical protein